jgi:hypothetical protein
MPFKGRYATKSLRARLKKPLEIKLRETPVPQ